MGKFICRVCSKIIGKTMYKVGCSGRCEAWFHARCVQLTNFEAKAFAWMKKPWFCISCKSKMPGQRCSYFLCNRSKKNTPGLRTFYFPIKDPKRCEKWIANSGNVDLIHVPREKLQNKYMCGNHFKKEHFLARNLCSTAVPIAYDFRVEKPSKTYGGSNLPDRVDATQSSTSANIQQPSTSVDIRYCTPVPVNTPPIKEEILEDTQDTPPVKEEILEDTQDTFAIKEEILEDTLSIKEEIFEDTPPIKKEIFEDTQDTPPIKEEILEDTQAIINMRGM